MSQKFHSILDRTSRAFARFFGPALEALKNVTPIGTWRQQAVSNGF